MQVFINFYSFLHWQKASLLVKNNIVKDYPCSCFLAQATRWWIQRAQIM